MQGYRVIQVDEATAADRRVYFTLVDATDGMTREDITVTGVKVRLSKNGSTTTAASSADIVKIDGTNMPGEYYLELAASEVDTLGKIVGYLAPTGCAPARIEVDVVDFDPYAAPSTPVEANVTQVSGDSTAADNLELAFDGTGYTASGLLVGLASGAITTAKFASGAIDSAALATSAAEEIADALLGRNVAGGSNTGRLVKEALYVLRNKVAISGTTMTVYGTDDSTSAFTATVTREAADAISTVDPA